MTVNLLERKAKTSYQNSAFEALSGVDLNDLAALRKLLPRAGSDKYAAIPVHAEGVEARADWLGARSIKKASKLWALRMGIAMCDLTTLEGADTPGKVRQLCMKAINPYSPFGDLPSAAELQIPSAAAICVYPSMVAAAKDALQGSNVKVASVATGFPSGQYPLSVRLRDVQTAVAAGADEIDMVINRGAFLSGRYDKVFDEIVKIKEACGTAHLKVIFETGELGGYNPVRLASHIAMMAGADFIKTSTGKISPAATLPVTLVMLEAIRDFYDATGKKIGMKPAGGIRTAKDSIKYLVMVNETLGEEWLTSDLFRFGASGLMNDLLSQIVKQLTGSYRSPEEFGKD